MADGLTSAFNSSIITTEHEKEGVMESQLLKDLYSRVVEGGGFNEELYRQYWDANHKFDYEVFYPCHVYGCGRINHRYDSPIGQEHWEDARRRRDVEYRVLRPDGSVIRNGFFSWEDAVQYARAHKKIGAWVF